MKKIVIALGGNALGNTPYEQLELVRETAKPIVDLIQDGNEVVIAHGNGPQVGMINLGLATAARTGSIKSDMPFPECGAMSQGYIGYHLQNAIGNELKSRGMDKETIYEMMAKARIDATIRLIPDVRTRAEISEYVGGGNEDDEEGETA
jgi:carbamate kinase